jgi:8-oxo-dGTP diphosphatase
MRKQCVGLSVKAIVRDGKGRCLLIRRSSESRHWPGKWDLPGGKVDAGESFDTALVREIAEETGLKAVLKGLVGAVEFELPGVRVVCLVLEAASRSAQVRLSPEHQEYQWAERRQLGQLDIFDPLQPLLKSYARPCRRRSC